MQSRGGEQRDVEVNAGECGQDAGCSEDERDKKLFKFFSQLNSESQAKALRMHAEK